MDNLYYEEGVLINTLIRLLKMKKTPSIVIDTNKQSTIFAHNWLHGTEHSANTHGTLIITNRDRSDNYHTSTINRLEYISECTFSFLPKDALVNIDGTTFTGEFVRLHGVDAGGKKKTIDIAGNREGNGRNSIIYAVISALVSTLVTAEDDETKSDMLNYLNSIPFAVYWKGLDGQIIGHNYRFKNLAPDNYEFTDASLVMEKLRLNMDKSHWEDDYVIKHKKLLSDIEILNSGKWLSLSKTYAIHPLSDDMLAIVCIIEDISEHMLKDHDELRLNYVNSVFLKRMIAGSKHVGFILEGSESLPVMYISENMESLGLDRDIMLSGRFSFIDCIHTEDRNRVIQAFAGKGDMEAENTIAFNIYTKDGDSASIRAHYRKNGYLYNNSIIIYGILSTEKAV